MNKFMFKKVYEDLLYRVELEGKKNPSWLMGYLQGLGSGTLTGFQCAALIDLLLVPLEKPVVPDEAVAAVNVPEEEKELSVDGSASQSLLKTLAQR